MCRLFLCVAYLCERILLFLSVFNAPLTMPTMRVCKYLCGYVNVWCVCLCAIHMCHAFVCVVCFCLNCMSKTCPSSQFTMLRARFRPCWYSNVGYLCLCAIYECFNFFFTTCFCKQILLLLSLCDV